MMGLLGNISRGIAKALDVTTVALAHPIQTTTAVLSKKSTVNDVITAHFSQSKGEQVKDIILGTAGIAGTIVGGAAIGTAAKAGTLLPTAGAAAKSLIPTTAKGKVIAAGATYVAGAAILEKPSLAISAPKDVLNFGGDVGKLIANPSYEKAKELVSESPILSAGTGLLLAGGAIKAIAPAIATARQTSAIREQTEAIRTDGIKVIDKTPEFSVTPINEGVTSPTMPETKGINTKSPSRRKRRSRKAVMPSISQKVNVVVSNKSSSVGIRSTKRLINKEVLPL